MIETMNRAGFGRVVKLARIRHPAANIQKNIRIIRHAAKFGYSDAARKYGTSRQYVLILIKRYYRVALEVIRQDEESKGPE